jgi:hypothetical protein
VPLPGDDGDDDANNRRSRTLSEMNAVDVVSLVVQRKTP